jgi:hypothetical protein
VGNTSANPGPGTYNSIIDLKKKSGNTKFGNDVRKPLYDSDISVPGPG